MKKLLPPHLFVLFALTMAGLCWALGSPHTLAKPYTLAAVVLLIGGLGLAFWAKRLFKQHQTTAFTFDAPGTLVTEGPFRLSRNPMYLGLALALFGVAILLGLAPSSMALALLFVIILDCWYISYEERAMHARFGESYTLYCAQVRRWL